MYYIIVPILKMVQSFKYKVFSYKINEANT
jgi:hypothetical protein